eukprot:TRINITY_DN8090_c0_g2_i2.p1 TRINITY_DN8090_c0_g2~~TRINITY_DN8090_c0_g2_i2.p1  ORF type:complete len:389 (+),score=55.52 TRINITY_DN8090_c0_g2_i2:189-1355(+)
MVPGSVARKANSRALLQGFAKDSPKDLAKDFAMDFAKDFAKDFALQSATFLCILKDMYEIFTNRNLETFFACNAEELNVLKAMMDKRTMKKAEAASILADAVHQYDGNTTQLQADTVFFVATKEIRKLVHAEWLNGTRYAKWSSQASSWSRRSSSSASRPASCSTKPSSLARETGLCHGCETSILLRMASVSRSQGQGQQHPQPAPGLAGRTAAPGESRPLRCGNHHHRQHDSVAEGCEPRSHRHSRPVLGGVLEHCKQDASPGGSFQYFMIAQFAAVQTCTDCGPERCSVLPLSVPPMGRLASASPLSIGCVVIRNSIACPALGADPVVACGCTTRLCKSLRAYWSWTSSSRSFAIMALLELFIDKRRHLADFLSSATRTGPHRRGC